MSERDQWIEKHGSDRLKKILQLGLADQCEGIYFDERLKHEMGDTWGIMAMGYGFSSARRPTMDALINFEREKVKYPDLHFDLLSWTDNNGSESYFYIATDFLGKLVYKKLG